MLDQTMTSTAAAAARDENRWKEGPQALNSSEERANGLGASLQLFNLTKTRRRKHAAAPMQASS